MKKSNRNIERDIVDRLQNHEFDFDPKAWDQMEAMLDNEPKGFWAAFQSNHGTKIIAGVVVLLLFAMSVYYALPEGNTSSHELAKKHLLKGSVAIENENFENGAASIQSTTEASNEAEIESSSKQVLSEEFDHSITTSNTTKQELVATIDKTRTAEAELQTSLTSNEIKNSNKSIAKPNQFASQTNVAQSNSYHLNKHSVAYTTGKLVEPRTQQNPDASKRKLESIQATDVAAISNSNVKDEAKNRKELVAKAPVVLSERIALAEVSLLDQSPFTSLLVNEANNLNLVPAYERTKTLKRLQRKWNFGIFAGIHRGLDYTDTRSNGYSGIVGAFVERKLSNSLGLQLQVNLKRTPNLNSSFSFENYYETPTSLFKVEGSYSYTNSDVLELPLMLSKSVFGGKVKLMGGIKYARILNTATVPVIDKNIERYNFATLFSDDNLRDSDYTLQGNSIFELATVENSSLSLNENPVNQRINAIRKNDFGLVAAVGYQFNTKLSVDLRYDQGVVDIAPNALFNNENFDSSNSLHLLLKYQF